MKCRPFDSPCDASLPSVRIGVALRGVSGPSYPAPRPTQILLQSELNGAQA